MEGCRGNRSSASFKNSATGERTHAFLEVAAREFHERSSRQLTWVEEGWEAEVVEEVAARVAEEGCNREIWRRHQSDDRWHHRSTKAQVMKEADILLGWRRAWREGRRGGGGEGGWGGLQGSIEAELCRNIAETFQKQH